jgi:ABC-type nitrate/sulfonate/bicarbonate transport system substrate-binding protein
MQLNRQFAASAALAMGLGLATGVAAQTHRELTANVFQSAALWPIWVAQHEGFLADHGLALNLIYTTASRPQMVGLIEGQFEIASTALDNVIAYMEGQGGVTFETPPQLVAVAGQGDGFLSVISRADIRSFDDLRGQPVAVDALTTGFAFVLQDMIAAAGLAPSDYTLDSVGGTGERWRALQNGTHAAALLTPPFTLTAESMGFNILGHASEVLDGYQGLVITLRRDWAEENADTVVELIRAYRAALDWLYDPANIDRAVEILIAEMPNTTDEIARAAYALQVHPDRGFNRDGGIDLAGARTVMELRSRYRGISPPLADLDRYVDMSYFNRAAAP